MEKKVEMTHAELKEALERAHAWGYLKIKPKMPDHHILMCSSLECEASFDEFVKNEKRRFREVA